MTTVISADALAGLRQPGTPAELLRQQSLARPDKEALVCAQVRLTYRCLEAASAAVKNQLNELGMRKGDKIGLLFPNQPGYVVSFFGASGLGATVVPINPLLKSEEIAHILSDSEARALIVHESALQEVIRALPEVPSIEQVIVCRTTAGPIQDSEVTRRVSLVDLVSFTDGKPAGSWVEPVDPGSDLVLLVYTSGTTGKPKGAMLTHANLFSAIESALEAFRLNDSDRFLAVLPLCHIYGLAVVMLGTMWRGGTLVVLEKFDAGQALATIESERVTLVPAVPAMYQFMLMELDRNKYDLSSVRICLSGAAALPTDLIARIEERFGAVLVEGYGMTESSCIATVNPPDGVRKPGSVGPAVKNVAVEVLADNGQVLPPGEKNIGQVALKGPNVMRGYYKRPEATQECFSDGWFLTGDLGYKDEDGYLYLVGRQKELIIRGGQNIYPREVEEVILRMPEVAEAAVIGVPDRFMGERVKAVVVPRPGAGLTEEQVKEFCAARLAEYKVPRLVEFLAQLPRNSTGKVLKRLLT